MSDSLKTQGYLVSGAGSGIGRAIAQALASARAGNRVFLLGRNRERLEKTRESLVNPESHRIIQADLTDAGGLAAAMREAGLQSSNLRAVVANAGLGGENRYGEEDRWDEILATNLTGTYRLVNEALPALRAGDAAGPRQILIVSSILARIGVPRYSAYCASKAGLLGLMRSWAAELAPEGIRVNAICPGWVETEMAVNGLEAMAHAGGKSLEQVRARELGRVPLGKMSQPAEIAALVEFLLSGRETSITGQALDINNGAY